MEVFWYLPTQGDERYLGTSKGRREPDLGYLRQITQAVDYLGYSGMLLGTGTKQEGWIVASSLITATERLKFLVAIRPSVMSPSLCARMAATFDQLSKGRILLNLVAGGNTQQLKGDGIFQEHDQRYEACDEFAQVWKLLFTGEIVDFKGKYFHIEGARLDFPPVQTPYPQLYFGGSSPAALEVAAKHIDVYLTWGEPPQLAAEKIDQVRKLAAVQGRIVRFGIRLHSIVRETEREAWEAANKLIENLDDDRIAATARNFSKSESVGQQRMTALHGGDRTKLEVSPNLWAGVGLARGGAGTALVGSPANVAARMKEYAEIGIETFIMSGYPSLEEAYLLAELVFPLLPLNDYEDPLRRDTVQVLGKSYGGINGQDRVHASG